MKNKFTRLDASNTSSTSILDKSLTVNKDDRMLSSYSIEENSRAASAVIADDYSNNTATTGYVEVNSSISGEIETAYDEDWIQVTLEAGKTYQIDLEGSSTNAGTLYDPNIIGVFGSNGEYLSIYDDDSGEGWNSRIIMQAEASGDHYISANGIASNVGSYQLSVTEIAPIEDDFENNEQTTGLVEVNGFTNGEINYHGDEDWIKVTLEAGQAYQIDLEAVSTNAGTLEDPYINGIYDANGNYLEGFYNDDAGEGTNSRVVIAPESSGDYYVSVNGYDSNIGSYQVSVTEIAPLMDDYENNTNTTGVLEINGIATGEINYINDEDWFKVTLQAGQAYKVDLVDYGTDAIEFPFFVILNSTGNFYEDYEYFAFDENSVSAEFIVNEGGDYYISTMGNDGNTGSYQLYINEVDIITEPSDTQPPYFINALASGSSDTVGWDNDITYYFSDGTDNVENNPEGFTQLQIQSVIDSLQAWQDIGNFTFTRVSTSNQADMIFYRDSSPSEIGASAYAYFYGNVHIDVTEDIDYISGLHDHILTHEIGHALGLDHPFEYDGRDVYRDPLPYSEDSTDNTQMSYTFGYGEDGYTPTAYQGPQLYDIAAIHYMYGVNSSINTGNTTYDIREKYIADASGTDTIDASNEQQQVFISLEEGSWNYIGYQSNSILDDNQSFIGYNTYIENAKGGSANDTLIGNYLSNTLNGNAGADTMIGGLGNDTYFVDNTSDVVIEEAGEGHDTIKSSIFYNLNTTAEHIEDLTLIGTSNIAAVGNTLDNVLTGNNGNNTLNGYIGNDILYGGAGIDRLIGGTGDDTYIIDSQEDEIVEYANQGNDTIDSSITYNLNLKATDVENLTLTGTNNTTAIGNILDNVLTGNSGNNTLNGYRGVDTMIGGLGNDTYYVDNRNDVVIEEAGEGHDTIKSSIFYNLNTTAEHIEDLTLIGSSNIAAIGNTLDNVLTGNSGNNTLNGYIGNDILYGGAGIDRLIGGTGDDTYIIDSQEDEIIEYANQGNDTIDSSITYNLNLKATNVENLTLTGTNNTTAIGNILDNVLTGNDGNNILSGYRGADTMIGGLGNDTYYVDNRNDVVIEEAGEGHDTIKSSVFYNLNTTAEHVEDLTLIGSSNIAAIGNTLDNVLTGNSGNNTLNGYKGNDILDAGAGKDTLIGGSGNDTFVFKSIEDSSVDLSLMDVITDFTTGRDVIDVSGIDANNQQSGDQAFTIIESNQSFSSAGQLKLADNVLYGEVDGDGQADFGIKVNNVSQLQVDDLIL